MFDDTTRAAERTAVEVPDDGGRRSTLERGLTTVEYAIGIVLVITIVGLLIKAAGEGWFMTLVKTLVTAIFKAITQGVLG